MFSQHNAYGLAVWAPAKVNLFLEVFGKRADGFHEIATLMVTVTLYDTLEFKEDPRGNVALWSDNSGISTGPDNLVCRAAELVRNHLKIRQGVQVGLRKRIPLGAGLAGGSSDAAATMFGLNRLWKLGLSRADLTELGAQIGSDVPFFFSGPVAWCTGRGEKVEPLSLDKPFWLVLVCPVVGLSTAEVYRHVQVPATPMTGAEIRRAVKEGNVAEVGKWLHNRLESAAQILCPALAEIRARLASVAPAGQLMSGSGTSHFALCRERKEAFRLARALLHGSDKRFCPTVLPVRNCVDLA
ncbi:MAG TPA: 4-(cytidine 5'-diphospho)-2-C-methyl-D-erythritol kinase, partial [Gemmataceae bacterium]|nr:4-(cytidine 5'-diphospho)-2-C-methyl-D-erythritol kinase [Gemmataceae bacterium]